jgi:hypothetical protein
MRIATSLLAATALSLAALVPVPVTAETALCNGPCLLTGGERGDYYQYFAPPLSKLLQKAWADAPIATSPGAPASLAWVVGHPDSYALIQGDVLARALKDAAVGGKIKVIRSIGIGNEAVLAIMNDKIFGRSRGSWGAVARHAKQVRFATASRESGPGATMQALQALDPDNLGKANVAYDGSMGAAIKAVQDGEQDVALMVQFANPENPRFVAIKAAHLHFAPVLMPAMKSLTFPDGSPGLHAVRERADRRRRNRRGVHANPVRHWGRERQCRSNAGVRRRDRGGFHAAPERLRTLLEVHEGGDEECREQCIRCRRQSREVGLGPDVKATDHIAAVRGTPLNQ